MISERNLVRYFVFTADKILVSLGYGKIKKYNPFYFYQFTGEAAELFNPAPGIFFTSVDMIRLKWRYIYFICNFIFYNSFFRNLLLAPILSTSMKEQNSMFKVGKRHRLQSHCWIVKWIFCLLRLIKRGNKIIFHCNFGQLLLNFKLVT